MKYNEETIITTLIQAFCRNQYKQNSKIYKETLKLCLKKYELYKIKQEENQIYNAS